MSRVLKKEVWPYRVTMRLTNSDDRRLWLLHNIGPCPETWIAVGALHPIFHFKREEDLTHFLLRWAK